MAYSLDFRKHIFKVKEKEGLTFKETSERFSICIRTLFRWSNNIEPKKKRNRPSIKLDMKALRKDVLDHPDKYQSERAKQFGVCQSTIFYALKRLNISFKKNALSSKS